MVQKNTHKKIARDAQENSLQKWSNSWTATIELRIASLLVVSIVFSGEELLVNVSIMTLTGINAVIAVACK
jgi:hypothetical protein